MSAYPLVEFPENARHRRDGSRNPSTPAQTHQQYPVKFGMERATANPSLARQYFRLNNGNESTTNVVSGVGILIGLFLAAGLAAYSILEGSDSTLYLVFSTLGVGSVLVSTVSIYVKTKQTCLPYVLIAHARSQRLEVREMKGTKCHCGMYEVGKGDRLVGRRHPVKLHLSLANIVECKCLVNRSDGVYGFLQIRYCVPDIQCVGVSNICDDASVANQLTYETIVNEKPIKLACVYEAINFIMLAAYRAKHANARRDEMLQWRQDKEDKAGKGKSKSKNKRDRLSRDSQNSGLSLGSNVKRRQKSKSKSRSESKDEFGNGHGDDRVNQYEFLLSKEEKDELKSQDYNESDGNANANAQGRAHPTANVGNGGKVAAGVIGASGISAAGVEIAKDPDKLESVFSKKKFPHW